MILYVYSGITKNNSDNRGNAMGRVYKNIKQNSITKNNAGFTLVELVVVLVLMTIMLGVAIAGGIGWQDWAQFNHEDAMAEEIFFAAQNQLTDYDSSGALQKKVADELLKIGTSNTGYDSSIVLSESMLEQISYAMNGEDTVTYKWADVWKLNQNPDSQKGTIIRLKADKGDYADYLNGNLANSSDKSKLGAKILFDIVSPYVSDSGALNAAITLEFSPDSAQVFSVCYSDRVDTLLYSGQSAGSGKTSVSVMNRILSVRRENMLGYYSVDELAQRIKGRGKAKSDVMLEIENSDVLVMSVIDKANDTDKLKKGDTLLFNIYNGQTLGSKLMSFTIRYDDNLKTYSSFSQGLIEASAAPMKLSFNMQAGEYRGNDQVEFRVPVWKTDDTIYVILDAADVQAASLAYSKSIYFPGHSFSKDEPDPDENAFRNTYSFYRFGLADVTNYIYADVSVTRNYLTSDPVESGRKVDNKHVSHTSLIDPETGFKGECVCFDSYLKDDNSDISIDIKNARHFYNIRYETDYKRKAIEDSDETFNLKAGFSWNDFIGKGQDSTTNYFVNSYDKSKDNITRAVSGIDYDGIAAATRSLNVAGDNHTDTSVYPFPGFRRLSANDIFTQEKSYTKEDNESFVISDLDISIAANIVYGVYGQSVIDKCFDSDGKEDYSEILGSEASDPKKMKDARAGKLPLGLFAENLGTIKNITLNHHAVEGMEKVGNTTVYTCMVGGFTGNNIGKLENLTILDNVSNDVTSEKANKSRVTGRTDVGGILGRESFAVSEADDDVVIKGLLNYATVTGLENIGGIAGKIYVNYQESETNALPEKFADGYSISDDGKSTSGENVVRASKVSIVNSVNRGYVYGLSNDETLKNCSIDDKNVSATSSSFIGGIVGAALDGQKIDTAIPENYLSGNAENVVIKNCNSYISYDIDSIEDLNGLSDTTKHPALLHDNYVGGLIGYGRLAVVDNCNTKPEEEILSGKASKAFVFGDRYVGGVIGCSELCRFDMSIEDDADPNEISEYAATNYNNVIGRMYVGGIAGANGIGNIDPEEMDYRNPSSNEASPASGIDKEDNSDLFRDVLNSGVVLTLKSSHPYIPRIMDEWKDDNYESIATAFASEDLTGICGGIVGLNCTSIRNCKNIQSEDTKKLAMNLITGDESTDMYSDTVSAESLDSIMSNSHFGGNAIGGIAGACISGGVINMPINQKDYYSEIDSVVFGQDYVGGAVGLIKNEDNLEVYDCLPRKAANDSSGLLVVGRDVVGGLVGRVGGIYYDHSQLSASYKVKGRFAVGGAFGCITSDKDIAASIDGTTDKISVDGIAYVGGYLGIADSKDDISLKGVTNIAYDVDYVTVNGKYFVGGIAGCIAGSDKTIETISGNEFAVSNAVTVNADIFAGGIAGLYTINSELDDFNSLSANYADKNGKLYKLITDNLVESNSYVDYKKAYANIVSDDLSGSVDWGTIPSDSCNIEFTDSTDRNKAIINAKLYAGGLFGYVPNEAKVSITGFVNESNISVSEVLDSSEVTNDGTGEASVKYAYLGGVIGRVQSGMKLINCTNKISGEDVYTSNATYLGGLAEINAGVVRGTGEKKTNGEVKAEGYLTNSTSFSYSNKNIGAIVGINGTPLTKVTYDADGNPDDNSTGVLMYCKNTGDNVKVEATGDAGNASGIAAAVGGDSAICYCVNEGKVKAVKESAGIVGNVVAGSIDIWDCTNTGTIEGVDLAAGIVGKDLASENLSVTDCINKGLISADNGKAAGIMSLDSSSSHSSSQDDFVISGCINYGDVDGKTSAAGILAESTSSYVKIDNSANVGLITISGKHPGGSNVNGDIYEADSSLNAAGIVCNTNGNGVIRLCRNYGPGLYYGITKEPAESIHYCFDATNATKHIGEVADASGILKKYANYYRGEDKELVRDKKFKALMMYSNESINDGINLNDYVLSPGQNIEDMRYHKEAGNLISDNGNKLKYVIQPVYNYVGIPNASVDIDKLGIVWDNYDKDDIDEYMSKYNNRDVNSSEYSDFVNNYLDEAADLVARKSGLLSTVFNTLIRLILGKDIKYDVDAFRSKMGINDGYEILGRYRTRYNTNDFYNAVSYEVAESEKWDYYSNYIYATYIYMINEKYDDIKDRNLSGRKQYFQALLLANADRYSMQAYNIAKKSYTIDYNVKVFCNTDDNDQTNDLSVDITGIKCTIHETNEKVLNTVYISDIADGVRVRVESDNDSEQSIWLAVPTGFSVNNISKIEISINSYSFLETLVGYEKYIGVRAFEWNDGSDMVIMPSHDVGEMLTVNPFANVTDVFGLVNVLSDVNNVDSFEAESEFYVKSVSGGKSQYTLYGYDTGIGNLDYSNNLLDNFDNNNSNNFNSYNSSYRKKVFEETDAKYVDFINNLSGIGFNNSGVGLGDDSWDEGVSLSNEEAPQVTESIPEDEQADAIASPNDAYSQDE